MKTRLIALFLTAVAFITTGCAASVRYNRGYYRQNPGVGYRYDRDQRRDWDRHERRDRYYDRDGYRRY